MLLPLRPSCKGAIPAFMSLIGVCDYDVSLK